MAMIHVNRGATSLGVFSEEEIREGLRSGRFAPSDIGWREGMATWQPLSQFPELAAWYSCRDLWTSCALEVSKRTAVTRQRSRDCGTHYRLCSDRILADLCCFPRRCLFPQVNQSFRKLGNLYLMNERIPQPSRVPMQQSFPSAPQRISVVDFDMTFGRMVVCLIIFAAFFGGIAALLQHH